MGFSSVVHSAGNRLNLGGFKPLKIERVAVDSYRMIGREFSGSYRSDTIRQYFDEMRQLLEAHNSNDPIIIIYDQEPEGMRGNIKNFVGVFVTSEIKHSKTGLQERVVIADSAVRVSKACHPSLMPNPEKINSYIDAELGDAGESPSIELYYPDNRLVVERPFD